MRQIRQLDREGRHKEALELYNLLISESFNWDASKAA